MSDILKCGGGWGLWDLVRSSCLVKKYTNTANGDPRARKEKGIRLTATIQTGKNRASRSGGDHAKRKFFQKQGIIKDILKL